MSEQDEQVVEATSSNDEQQVEQETEVNVEDTEDIDTLRLQLAEALEAKRQINARAKKAEAELKTLKGSKPTEATQPITNTKPALSEIDVEVKILKAQGKDNEYIEHLRKVAAVTGKSLIEAQTDSLATTWEKDRDNEAKAKKSQLGASRGSAQVKKEKTLQTPNLSDDEFKELWKSQLGR